MRCRLPLHVLRLLQGEPLRRAEDLREHDERCAVLGEWLRERSSVAGVFGKAVSQHALLGLA